MRSFEQMIVAVVVEVEIELLGAEFEGRNLSLSHFGCSEPLHYFQWRCPSLSSGWRVVIVGVVAGGAGV